ncbi:MAG: lipopolysaccharide biosynthesis protein [Terriglobia bacterium]
MKPFDRSGAFRPTADGVRRLAVRGAGITVFSGGLGLGIQIIATVVLARLLTPSDFGVVTMVTTFSLLFVNFGRNGFTEAVLQREEIDRVLVSNLFWINLGAGILLTVGFAAAGSLMARFYRDPVVARVAIGTSVTIFIGSTSVLHGALLARAMRFSVISANGIFSRTLSVAVSILLAWAGWGYWALVAGLIVQPLSAAIGLWWLCQWIPSLPRRAPGTAAMVRFAINIYGRFSVNYFARNTDNLLVGWRFNAQALGFYKKAYDLFALSESQLVSPLTVVAVSALSRFDRHSGQFRRYLLGALGVVAFVGMGVGADLSLVGKDVIRLLLGPGWEESGRIFTCFGPGIGIMLLYSTHGWIHLSIGRADRWLRWGIVESSVTCLLFLLALPWGPVGIAVAWTASFWVLAIPAFWYAGRPINLGVASVLAALWKYPAASFVAGYACAALLRGTPFLIVASDAGVAAARILLVSLLFGALYLGTVILLHGGCAPVYRVGALIREMIPWERFSRPSPAMAGGVGTGENLPLTGKKGDELAS